MTDIYLFDWGDTLMVDFPGVPGKMCNWKTVSPVDGAETALACLSKKADLYIATGAQDSSEKDIRKAFQRVALDQYLSGYFCSSNIGCNKGHPDFLPLILKQLGKAPNQVTMIGNNLISDIIPAQKLGINVIWYNPDTISEVTADIHTISSLTELCGK